MATTTATVLGDRDEVLKGLRGQKVHVPDMRPIFADWRGAYQEFASPHLDELRKYVDKRVASLYCNEGKCKRLKAADFGYFTAVWWPEAGWEEIQTLAALVIWLFTWDDEIDEPTGFCSDNFEAAQVYRAATLRFVQYELSLSPKGPRPCPQNNIIQSFDIIGEALRKRYTLYQRQRFYEEITRFMVASEFEQRLRLAGKVPTLDEYWLFRLGTSAVYIGVAAGELSIPSSMPKRIMEHPAMGVMWDATNKIISIVNDLLSLKKEMKLGCIDSIVPLTYARMPDVQLAIADSEQALIASKEALDRAAGELRSVARDYIEDVNKFIEVCRSNCVGNLVWSLKTGRYSMAESMNPDGSQTFIL